MSLLFVFHRQKMLTPQLFQSLVSHLKTQDLSLSQQVMLQSCLPHYL